MDQNELEDFLRLKAYSKQLSIQLNRAEREIEIMKEDRKLAGGDLRTLKRDALMLKYVGENERLRERVKTLEKDVEKLIIKLNQK